MVAYPIVRESATIREVVCCVTLLAEALVQLGNPIEALAWVEQGAGLLDGIDDQLWQERAALALAFGRAYLGAGEEARGEAELRRCAQLLGRAGGHRSVALLWRGLGDSWAERRQRGPAMAAYQSAFTVLGMPAIPAAVRGQRRAVS